MLAIAGVLFFVARFPLKITKKACIGKQDMFKFNLAENGTTVKTEIIAGITTFLSMVYILAAATA
jgi:hypothetical protein